MSIVRFIRAMRDPDRWVGKLEFQGAILDAQFGRALRRGAHLPKARRSWLPWRRPEPEEIRIVERPVSTLPPAAAVETAVNTLLGEARVRAHDEVDRHIAGLPRGRERAAKWSPLVLAHELRTTRVIETELRRERRRAGEAVPDVDYRCRLEGEMKALEAELSAERHAESFAPLTEKEHHTKTGQLLLVRLLLDLDNTREDLKRRRAVRPAGAAAGTADDGGNLAPQAERRGIDLGPEL